MTAKCGTDSGYQAHRRRGEQACGPCRKARAEYMTEHRKNPAVRMRAGLQHTARLRALTRLGKAHPEEYRRLYVEESAHIYQAQS